MEQGYIYLHRSLLDWEWYQDINTKTVFLHLLLTVNYQPKKWQGITIERGQRICTYEGLAEETGLSVQNVRTVINHLKLTSEITWKKKKKYSLVQVVNYDKYQLVTSKKEQKHRLEQVLCDDGQQDSTCCQHVANKRLLSTTDINHAKLTSKLTSKKEQKYSLEQAVNHDERQELTSKLTSCQQAANMLLTTTKEKKKKEINNNNIPPCSPPLHSSESKKSLEKVQWAENVAMTNAQYEKLLCTYGEADTKRLIEILDNYKGATGKKYADDYRAILSWVVNRLKEDKSKKHITPKQQLLSSSCYNDYDSVLNR